MKLTWNAAEADEVETKGARKTSERSERGVGSKRRKKVKTGTYTEKPVREPENISKEGKAPLLLKNVQTDEGKQKNGKL